MNEAFDPLNLLLLGVAIIVFLRLRNVLGRRTGNERPPSDPFSHRKSNEKTGESAKDNNVIKLPSRDGFPAEAEQTIRTEDLPPIWEGYAESGSPLAQGMEAIAGADANFHPKTFLEGAKSAYEMIVTSYAEGDRLVLKDLLSQEVYDGFSRALDDRDRDGLIVEMTFVGIDDAKMINARLDHRQAFVTIKFSSELITTTKNTSGAIVDGDPKTIVNVNDIWTFARDTSSTDPNWKVVATESAS